MSGSTKLSCVNALKNDHITPSVRKTELQLLFQWLEVVDSVHLITDVHLGRNNSKMALK